MLTDTTRTSPYPARTDELSREIQEKKTRVLSKLMGYGNVLVAFSGGIDSTLMALLAKMALGDRALAVTADSPSIPASELDEAKSLAKEIGIKHMLVKTNELEDPNYVVNPSNRSYF